MFWVVVAILVVGYFIVRAIYSVSRDAKATAQQKLLPIGKRNEMLRELIQNLQTRLTNDYTKEIEDRKQETRGKKAHEQEWDKEFIVRRKKELTDFGKLVEINARLCERFKSDDHNLLEQQTDWCRLLEHYRDIQVEYDLNKAYIENYLDPKHDEVTDRERGGEMHEIYKRIMARAKAEKILTKELALSVTTHNLG